MYHKSLEEKQYVPWLTAALLAPLLQTASGSSWLLTAGLASITLLICWGVGRTDCCSTKGTWLHAIQWLWISVVASQILHWIMFCWPDYDNYYVVPLILLALAAWSARNGTEVSSRVGCVLLWPLLIVFGVLLLAAGKEIKAEYLRPELMADSNLITVLLIPAMGGYLYREKKALKQFAGYSAIAVAVSIAVMGVLSATICGNVDSPIYELSRSLKLFGFAQRLESFAAAAMTLGYFLTISLLLGIQSSIAAQHATVGSRTGIAASAVLTGVLFLTGVIIDGRILALGSIVCWVALPSLLRLKSILKNGN